VSRVDLLVMAPATAQPTGSWQIWLNLKRKKLVRDGFSSHLRGFTSTLGRFRTSVFRIPKIPDDNFVMRKQ
jgi:hypothetical protein